MNAREAAFLSLLKYENHGVYSNIELSYSIERNHLELSLIHISEPTRRS